MKYIVLILIIFFHTSTLYAKSNNEPVEKKNDKIKKNTNDYIEKFKTDFTVKFFISSESLNFGITRPDKDNTLYYEPEELSKKGIEISYKFITLSYAQDIFNPDNNINFSASLFKRRFGFELYYQYFKNIFIYNDEGKTPKDISNDYYPKMQLRNNSLNLYYFFRDSFSYRASFQQTEKQKRFSWSHFIKIRTSYFSVNNNGPIIPDNLQYLYESFATVNRGEISSLAALIGISCTLTFYNFYFTPVISSGWSNNWQEFSSDSTVFKSTNNGICFDMAMAIGFNSNYFFLGLVSSFNSNDGTFGPAEWDFDNIQTKLFLGFRF